MLTAKHCFGIYRNENGNEVFANSYNLSRFSQITLGYRPRTEPNETVKIGVVSGSVTLHRDLDLAYFNIVRNVPAPWQPTPIWQENLPLKKGNRVLILGYGNHNQPRTGGILRYGAMEFTGRWLSEVEYSSKERHRSLLEFKPSSEKQKSNSGDSGGGVYKWENGHWGLIGIISGGSNVRKLAADVRQPSTRAWFRQ